MARIFMDGFETGSFDLWTGPGAGANWATASTTIPAGMSGTYTCYCQSYHGCYKTLSTSKSELYFSFKYCFNSAQTDSKAVILFKDSGSTTIAALTRNVVTGLLEAKRGGDSGTLLSTGSILMTVSKTYLIEIYYKPLNSGGVFTTKIDGIQDVNYSGDTTNSLENIQTICLGYSESNASCYFDDFVIDDANWIGNTKLGIIVPDGTGTTNSWTASAGNAWDCLNEKPPSDTDYVYSNTTNQIATYAMTTIANMNSVKSIQLQGRAAYEGSPTPTKIQLGVRASGTDYFATDISPGIGFAMNSKILELNPADSAAWEQADIDALEIGVKAIA